MVNLFAILLLIYKSPITQVNAVKISQKENENECQSIQQLLQNGLDTFFDEDSQQVNHFNDYFIENKQKYKDQMKFAQV